MQDWAKVTTQSRRSARRARPTLWGLCQFPLQGQIKVSMRIESRNKQVGFPGFELRKLKESSIDVGFMGQRHPAIRRESFRLLFQHCHVLLEAISTNMLLDHGFAHLAHSLQPSKESRPHPIACFACWDLRLYLVHGTSNLSRTSQQLGIWY